MEIAPKRKYTCLKTKGKYNGGQRAAPAKNRTKRKDKHPNHVAMVLVMDGLTGKTRFVRADELG